MCKPCITILGASSPEWFAESYKASLLSGGFLARFLFCPSEEPGRYVGHPGPRDEGVEAMLAEHLRRVASLAGRADLSAVRRGFNAWDQTAREHLRRNCPPEFAGMRARAGVLVLKAAMLFHVAVEPENLTIRVQDLERAIDYVERCQRRAEAYLNDEVARDRHELHRLRILNILRRAGGRASWSRALMNSHLTAREFTEAIVTLEQSDQLVIQSGRGKQRHLVLAEPSRDCSN